MTTKILLTVYFFIAILSSQLLAQSDLNDQNINGQPEIDLIIGLNQPSIDHHILFTNTDVIDVIINDIRDDEEKDDDVIEDLEDLLDELEDLDDPPTEPGKEELILVKELGELDLNIYPNPAKDYIKLQFDETNDYQVEIYDLIGNKVLSEVHSVDLGVELEFDLNSYQAGIYIMYIKTKEAMTIKKFAVKH